MASVKLWFLPTVSEVYYPHFVLIRASNQLYLGWASWVWSSWATSSTQVVPISQLGQAALHCLLGWQQGWGTRSSLPGHPLLSSAPPAASAALLVQSPTDCVPWTVVAAAVNAGGAEQRELAAVKQQPHGRSNSTMGLCPLLPRMRQNPNFLQGRVCKSSWRGCGFSPSLACKLRETGAHHAPSHPVFLHQPTNIPWNHHPAYSNKKLRPPGTSQHPLLL